MTYLRVRATTAAARAPRRPASQPSMHAPVITLPSPLTRYRILSYAACLRLRSSKVQPYCTPRVVSAGKPPKHTVSDLLNSDAPMAIPKSLVISLRAAQGPKGSIDGPPIPKLVCSVHRMYVLYLARMHVDRCRNTFSYYSVLGGKRWSRLLRTC